MGLFLIKHIPGARLGIWEITESLDDLIQQASLSDAEQAYYAQLQSPLRRKHWLSYRLILPHLVKPGAVSGITYDEFGKPHLENGAGNISVAHSGKYAVLIIGFNKPVGIDIEAIQPRIHKLTHKFLSHKEMKYKFLSHNTESLCLMWCAKEALYKLHGKGGLSFCEHLHIDPFDYSEKNQITGYINNNSVWEKYDLFYDTIDGYILVYALG